MRYTLLQVVQSVLASMDSDEVDSIHEGVTEAEDVAVIAQDVFYQILGEGEWPHLRAIFTLEPISDPDNPTAMQLPDNVRSLDTIRYNISKANQDKRVYHVIDYVAPMDFLDVVHTRNDTDDTVDVVEPKEFDLPEILIRNDKAPDFYTTFDDKILIFDSYDSAVESWLQASKTIAYGEKVPRFQFEDDWVVDLPEHLHPWFLAEVKANSHIYKKQQRSARDERVSLGQRARLRQNKDRTGIDYNDPRSLKNFGRKPSGREGTQKFGRR